MSGFTLAAARRRLAALVVLTALLVAATALGHGATLGQRWGAAAYVIAAGCTLFAPGWIVAQVLLGVLLVASLLLGGNPIGLLVAVGMVATIVATAELSALVARMEERRGVRMDVELRRVGAAAVGAAAVFSFVWLAGSLPGPDGLAGLLVAAGACLALAVLVAADRDSWKRTGLAASRPKSMAGTSVRHEAKDLLMDSSATPEWRSEEDA